jgi:tetratricopeptide (TPR) repeat protein
MGIKAYQAGNYVQAIEWFTSAARIDPTFAGLQYLLGCCYLATSNNDMAKACLTRARDYDSLRFRTDTSLNDIIRQVAAGRQSEGIYLVDGQQYLASISPNGIEGRELFYEHVHLRFEGNYALAMAIAKQIDMLIPDSPSPLSEWPTIDACATALALSDWDRYQALTGMLARLSDPPFTDQIDHQQQYQYIHEQVSYLADKMHAATLAECDLLYQRALASRPDDWVLHSNRAYILQKLGGLDAATQAWQEVGRLLPHIGQGPCQVGIIRAAQGQYDQAIEAFKEALAREPDMVLALDGLASALAAKGQHHQAIRLYRKALKIKPAFSQSRMGLALCLEAIGQAEQAQKELRLACDHPINTPTGLLAAGKAALDHGWIDQAIKHLTKAAQVAPTDAVIRLYLGLSLWRSGRQEQAIEQYAQSVRLDPNLPEAHFQLGLALGRSARHADAAAHFQQALKLRPDLLEARLNLAIALINLGQTQEALVHLKQVLSQDPTNATALRQLKRIQSSLQTP